MRIAATLSVCLLSLSFTVSAIPSAIPTGVTYYDPARAWNGYVVIPGSDNQTHLIDMTGQEVHRWAYEGSRAGRYPLIAPTASGVICWYSWSVRKISTKKPVPATAW